MTKYVITQHDRLYIKCEINNLKDLKEAIEISDNLTRVKKQLDKTINDKMYLVKECIDKAPIK